MKNILSIIFALFITSIIVVSCKKKEDRVIINDTATAPVVSILTPGSTDTIFLKKDSSAVNAINTSWSSADWGFNSAVKYTVQIMQKGGDWANAYNKVVDLAKTNSFTHAQINKIAVDLGLVSDPSLSEVATISTRIKAEIPNSKQVVYSNVVDKVIVTYPTNIEYPKLWVPGSYQGWSPSTAATLEDIDTKDGIYVGIIEKSNPDSLSSGDFKFTSIPDWVGVNYGAGAGPGELSTDAGAGNLNLVDGTYYFEVNTSNLTWTSELINWGLVGNATNNADLDADGTPDGWQSDKNMRYNPATKMYEITVDLVAGDIKFRKNDAWATNLGGDLGALSQDGSNIAIAADGNYTIKLSVTDSKCTITKN